MLFQRIRTDCCAVAEQATWVSIDGDMLAKYAGELVPYFDESLAHSAEHHLLHQGDETLIFFLILDSINFGSGYFPYIEKNRGASGYFTVAKQLTDHLSSHGIPSPAALARIDPETCSEIFRQDRQNPHAMELMRLFSVALSQLGKWVVERFDGDYLGFLKEADSAEAVVESLCEMPFFVDISSYFGRRVHFLKRAQIYLHDAKIAEPQHRLLQLSDVDCLTIFADNVIPYVLRADGVLKFHPWLEKRVEREELIALGSPEEIEIRACAIHASEIICKEINDKYRPMKVRELDFVLWTRGQALKKSTSLKRHRSRGVYY